jgi:DNA-directed RNA polymerase subunit RPC12/RpoP
MTLPHCLACKGILPGELLNQLDLAPCPHCGARVQAQVFPAFFRPPKTGGSGQLLMLENEASCFYHADKKAVVPCESCGRFLCALCDCEIAGKHFCPACLEVGPKKGRIRNLENSRMLYDSIALSLAVIPVVVIFGIYFTFITAPLAIYIALRYWNAPRSIVGRTRAR